MRVSSQALEPTAGWAACLWQVCGGGHDAQSQVHCTHTLRSTRRCVQAFANFDAWLADHPPQRLSRDVQDVLQSVREQHAAMVHFSILAVSWGTTVVSEVLNACVANVAEGATTGPHTVALEHPGQACVTP
jgi:hypothetical protein